MTLLLECAHLYLQMSKLVLSTFPLRLLIHARNQQLTLLSCSDINPVNMQRIRDLSDEIFGCEIERQVRQRQAERLANRACQDCVVCA